MKVLNSPIQYVGGKFWLFRTFMQYFPIHTKEVVSPFFGGGAIELNLASRGVKVIGYDKFEPVVNFWNVFPKSPNQFVVDVVELLKSESREYFTGIHNGDYFKEECNYKRALLYFLLTRMSFRSIAFNDYSLRSNFKDRLTPGVLDRVSKFDITGFSVQVSDAFDTIARHPDHLLYLDPPYSQLRDCLYGNSKEYHADFKHRDLFNLLKDRKRWMLSYNDVPFVRELYEDFAKLHLKRLGDGNIRKKEEVLIFSPDIVHISQCKPKQLSLFAGIK